MILLLFQDSCKQDRELIVVHSGECNIASVCARLHCPPHAECSSSELGPVECVCPACQPVYSPVCGNDNQTYSSECELYRTVCLAQHSDPRLALQLSYHGVCSSRPCSQAACSAPHAVCSNALQSCVCPDCNYSFQPVCGDNGILYDNLCLLQREACISNKIIKRQPRPFCGKISIMAFCYKL